MNKKLTHIRVEKLFGMFDHSISMRLKDRITIIHGPNGFGKTAILQMVEAVLTNQFSIFRHTPFKTFSLSFDDGLEIRVLKGGTQKNRATEENPRTLSIELHEKQRIHGEHRVELFSDTNRLDFPLEFIERHIDGLQRIGPESWLQLQTGRKLDIDDVIDIYGHMLPFRRPRSGELPEWLSTFPKAFDVRLIQAQRLINLSDRSKFAHSDTGFLFEPAVSSYSREIVAKMQEKRAEYGTVSQKLDSTFPSRVLLKKPSPPIAIQALEAKLAELDERRQRFMDSGLLAKEPHPHLGIGPREQVDPNTNGILSLYAEDVERKLAVFDEVSARIELFRELINKRFSYKTINIEAKEGFKLVSDTGLPLVPADLSSGEQHELVLLYELLFRTKPNALILIDEPELSLHVGWQVEFLRDLERIIKLSSFDVILATHSPQVINNRWDLTQELLGPTR